MITDELITYEVAKLAKEKGFNERTRRYYEANCVNPKAIEHCTGANCFNKYPKAVSAPTQSSLQRWLRDNRFVEVEVRHWPETNKYPHHYGWEGKDNLGDLMSYSSKMFDTYEQALEDALKYALENLV